MIGGMNPYNQITPKEKKGKSVASGYRRYLRLQRNMSVNTIDAYMRDLEKLLR